MSIVPMVFDTELYRMFAIRSPFLLSFHSLKAEARQKIIDKRVHVRTRLVNDAHDDIVTENGRDGDQQADNRRQQRAADARRQLPQISLFPLLCSQLHKRHHDAPYRAEQTTERR